MSSWFLEEGTVRTDLKCWHCIVVLAKKNEPTVSTIPIIGFSFFKQLMKKLYASNSPLLLNVPCTHQLLGASKQRQLCRIFANLVHAISTWLLAWPSANAWRQKGAPHLPDSIQTWYVSPRHTMSGRRAMSPWYTRHTMSGVCCLLRPWHQVGGILPVGEIPQRWRESGNVASTNFHKVQSSKLAKFQF